MSAAYLTLLAVLLAGFGSRDQVTVAGLTASQGARPALLVVALAVTCVTTGFAAWAGSIVAPEIVPQARLVLAALALALAGIESLVIVPRARPAEPTHSLGAAAVVLLAHQLTDAARFLVFGIAVLTLAPVPAGIGGLLGGIALLVAAWSAPALAAGPKTRLFRRLIGAGLLLLAVWLALGATGIL